MTLRSTSDSETSERRYAIYYAPPPESALWRFGSTWLGRDAASEGEHPRFEAPAAAAGIHMAINADARFYGFHATLKPPFALAAGETAEGLFAAVADFAGRQRPFDLPPLQLGDLDGFLALVLSRPCPEACRLADDCVAAFDRFRRPADAAELAKRRAARLSPAQEDLLHRWGYPFVFAEWRFHMTLTSRLNAETRKRVAAGLGTLLTADIVAPQCVDAICVFQQPNRQTPFSLIERFPFAG